MTEQPLTQEQLAAAAYADAVRQASERLKARTFEDIEKWAAGEKLRNTPLAAQMQSVSMTVAAVIYATVKPISGAQRDVAALTMLKGIGDTVRDLLILGPAPRNDVDAAQSTETPQ